MTEVIPGGRLWAGDIEAEKKQPSTQDSPLHPLDPFAGFLFGIGPPECFWGGGEV